MNTKVPYHSIGFHFQSDLSFLTLKGIGFHYIESTSYSWNNRNRKNYHCLLQYTVSGNGILEENGILYPQQSGDAFLIDIPGDSHYYLPETSPFWEVLYFEFSKECIPMLYKIRSMLGGPTLHLKSQPDLMKQMFHIYQLGLDNQIKNVFDNSKIAYSLFMDLFALSSSFNTRNSSKPQEAKHYIETHYFSLDLNLDEIAEYIGVSKFYITHEFTKEFGISPGKYLTYFRIEQACRLLRQTNHYTLDQIAQMVGFSNNNYFGKVFKKKKGITPNQYRCQNEQYDFIRVMHSSNKTIPPINIES